MKVRDMIRELKKDGWYLLNQEGSHRHFKHQRKSGKITIAKDDGEDLSGYIVRKIREQAGL